MMEDIFFGTEYEIISAGGDTGQAFIAQHKDEKFFLKRNSSPFLAALSALDIVPKLKWTRRVENGDVITAQKWINARVLSTAEMGDSKVARLLSKIHHSDKLKQMLLKMEEASFSPLDMFRNHQSIFPRQTKTEQEAIHYLEHNLEQIEDGIRVVCHGDINHNNWMISSEEELFLVDWDGAMLGDPAMDVSMLLYQYVPKENWKNWLEIYGGTYSKKLHRKLKWYALFQTLHRLGEGKLSQVEQQKANELLDLIVKDNEV